MIEAASGALEVTETLSDAKSKAGVQSLGRAFELLETMADMGGIAGVSDLAAASGLPLPTIHRLLRSLVTLGYARQVPSREYALGPRLVRLGEAANRLLESWANPHLRALAEKLGESVNFAMLDDTEVVYVAQAPGHHAMRMFTEVGHRADVHATAVGKAILATYPRAQATRIVERIRFTKYTPHTISNREQFERELEDIRHSGYATDRQEQELGVSCIAVPLPGIPARGAVSVSAPSARMTPDVLQAARQLLAETARNLHSDLEKLAY